jgi:drug/metabolite transporter (DMT)-like permease
VVGAGVGLALASAALWGTADYLGGTASRTHHPFVVVLWAQVAGLVFAAVLTVASGASLPAGEGLAWAIAAGLTGSLAIALFYAALAAGAMTIVAPLSACGAIIPVVVALAGGESPGALGFVGMVVALAGAVLVSVGAHAEHPTRLSPRALAYAIGAAVGIGMVLTLMQQAIDANGSDVLGVATVMRASGLVTVALAVALVVRAAPAVPRTDWLRIAAVGVFDVSANATFMAASGGGENAVVAVLGSLYPVTTVVLAAVLLHERPSRAQRAGILVAFAGVALLALR